jgi:ABC-type amino acid transport system permease subunit
VAQRIEQDDTTRGRRLRSAILLTALVAALGVLAAATLGVLVVGLTSLVDQALG